MEVVCSSGARNGRIAATDEDLRKALLTRFAKWLFLGLIGVQWGFVVEIVVNHASYRLVSSID